MALFIATTPLLSNLLPFGEPCELDAMAPEAGFGLQAGV